MSEPRRQVPALRVHQWLESWDGLDFDPDQNRSKPASSFYLFTMKASELKSLTGIHRRSAEVGRSDSEAGVQRPHDEGRSHEILQFVQFGFPWSALSPQKQATGLFDDLKKPGWLPTAIVLNICGARDGVHADDMVSVEDAEGMSTLGVPDASTPGWAPINPGRYPFQVIDGQHRLWAFADAENLDYELPVVAFNDLDLSWRAYLFYTINIKPKRINSSLAYDLYPLLRTEDWLERFEGHSVYRETRAQELTEALWSNSLSPWFERINMIGKRGGERMVSQAAWIRSLTATFIKAWDARRTPIGGLFGARVGRSGETLSWDRSQQAAFLIYAGTRLRDSLGATSAPWARAVVASSQGDALAPFSGPNTLLSTDQGIRGFLYVVNDLVYLRADDLDLEQWNSEGVRAATDDEAVEGEIQRLGSMPVGEFVSELCEVLATYDWRVSSAEGLSPEDRLRKSAFRGSGGYRNLREDLLRHINAQASGPLAEATKTALDLLGSEK